MKKPNYIKIYTDLINSKFPEKFSLIDLFKDKEELSVLDILIINNILFGKIELQDLSNPRHKSYDLETIKYIIDYQRQNQLTNTAISKLFHVSRNSVAKWKTVLLDFKV